MAVNVVRLADALRAVLTECAHDMQRAHDLKMDSDTYELVVARASGRMYMLLMDARPDEVREAADRLARAVA